MTFISELLAEKWCLSVELWPARTPEAAVRLTESLTRLEQLRPAFASITYGAGGSTRDRTHDLVTRIKAEGHMTPMAHLVCAAHRKEELVRILERYRDAGIENILALQGDRPLNATEDLPEGDLVYALELVELAKSIGSFCVSVAAHPEGHPESPDMKTDRELLANKLRVADFAITQFFFDVEDYFRLVDDMQTLGIDKPILPGIMPITNIRTVTKMAELSGCEVPPAILQRIEAATPEDVRKIGIEIATEMGEQLINADVPGLHFYTMNQVSATMEIASNLGLNSGLA